jgi:hypothetical protein
VIEKLPPKNIKIEWIIYDKYPLNRIFYKETYKYVHVASDTSISDCLGGSCPKFIYIVQYDKNIPKGTRYSRQFLDYIMPIYLSNNKIRMYVINFKYVNKFNII